MLFIFLCGVSAEVNSKDVSKVKRIGVEEFDKLRTNINTVILDVRSAAEVKNGSIPGSTNIDINSLNFSEKLEALDRSKTYLVHCAAGVRSARACKKMESMGFKELYDLGLGYDGWKKAQIQKRAKE